MPTEDNHIIPNHSVNDCQEFSLKARLEVEVTEGDDLTLPCEVDRAESEPTWVIGSNVLTWHKNDTMKTKYDGYDNISILRKASHPDASAVNLVITNIRQNNSGEYECVVYGTSDDPKSHRDLSAKTIVTVKPKQPLLAPDDQSQLTEQQQAELSTNPQGSTTNSDDQYKLMDFNNQPTQTLTDLLLTSTKTKQLQQSEQEKNSRRDTNSLLTRLTAPSESSYLSSSSYSNFPSAFTSPHASASSFNKQSRPFFSGSPTSASTSLASGLSASPITVATSSSTSAHLHHAHHNHQQSSFNGSNRSGLTIFLAATWPYALVLLALTLMMINLYLIFSLVKLQRRKKKRTSQQARQNNHPTIVCAGGSTSSNGSLQQEQQSRQHHNHHHHHQKQHVRDQTDCSI